MKKYQFAINQIKHDYSNIVQENGYDHLDFGVESRIALRLIANSHSRVPLSKTSPESVAHALFNAGALGLSLSPSLDHAMVVGEMSASGQAIAKLHVTYKGLLHLCAEAKALTHVTTWVIHEKDTVRLSNDLTSKPQVDIPNLFGDRGPVVGALCCVCTPNGDYLTTLMKADELNQVALLSGNEAWFGVFADEFRKKQTLKRALHSLASAQHGRLSKAAKYLSEDDLDLYERTERRAIVNSSRQVEAKANHRTRAEAYFKRTPQTETVATPTIEPEETATTQGLYFT
ncbi:TPA: recombinase RecT [Vibrio parahaemolyticus]|nr:recombinase RecT [Vibrio parahaemolyticus]